jgi:cell division protein FtsZ
MPSKKYANLLPRITIMSIGGRGATILDRLHAISSPQIQLVAVGMARSLEYATKIDTKIELPKSSGIQSGEDIPRHARESVEVCEAEIRAAVAGSDMVFLVGNIATESNVYQVAAVAEIIRSMSILTCFVGANAFPFQGIEALRQTVAGEKIVSAAVDGFLLVDSGKVMAMGSASEGLAQVNRVIEQMIAMILDIVSTHGIINVDFADLKTTIRSAGPLFFHSIEEDENSIEQMKDAIFLHPALTFPAVSELTRVVYVVYAGAGVLMDTITELGNYIASRVDASARIVFGVVSDEQMKGKVKVVLIGA